MPICTDLVKRFGKTYRITWDPAYETYNVPRKSRDPWYAQVPCMCGTVYPHGGTTLALEIDYHGKTAEKVGALPGVVLWQRGDQERTYLFDVRLWDQVAELV